MGRLIDADKYMNYLRAEINSEADIIAKHIKEDDPIGTVKDCGRIGRLQGLQWNRNMLELDCFTVEAIPKAEYENRLKADMVAMLEDLKQDFIAEAYGIETDCSDYVVNVADIDKVIQQKINEYKADQNDEIDCKHTDSEISKSFIEDVEAVKDQLPTTKNDLGVDAISRAEAQTEIKMNASRYTIAKERGGMGQVEWSDQLIKVSDAVGIIRHLPPATPIRSKGHWIDTDATHSKCDRCGAIFEIASANGEANYCPNCGAKMEKRLEEVEE